jgi:peptidoglycan hydrolase FlgJ
MATGIESLSRFQSMQNSSLAMPDGGDDKQLQETANEFEALFVKMMLDSMKKNLNKADRLLDGGQAEEIFDDMLYTEYSRILAKNADFGIAKSIVNQYSANKAYR